MAAAQVTRDRREQKRALAKLKKVNAQLKAEISPLRLNARRFALHKVSVLCYRYMLCESC